MILPDPANRISKAAVWYWAVRYGFYLVVALVVVGTPTALVPISHASRVTTFAVMAGLAALALVVVVGIPLWRYSIHRWEVTEGFIVTRSGAIFRDWRIVPLHRVQTVEVSQSIVERAFGVARLVVRTASYAGSTEVPGLNADVARDVAGELSQALAGSGHSGSADDGA
jgi:membrane protein YdbS with pleckstrin-like domain